MAKTHTFNDLLSNDDADIVDVMKLRAQSHGERIACTFLSDGESVEHTLSYQQLDRNARKIAAYLVEVGAAGKVVPLLLTTQINFVSAFYGCLYAGAIAVPFYPPRGRTKKTFYAMLENSGAEFAIASERTRKRLAQDPQLSEVTLITTEEAMSGPEDWNDKGKYPGNLAYLQYTSGSTAQPRGVEITHRQLLAHVKMIWEKFEQNEQSILVSWLPMFHDMGLVGTLITPLVFGVQTILMRPEHFLSKPSRWLKAISKYRATSTGAPNFAYDLCVDRVTDQDCEHLDLSCWTMAFNGAESVRSKTLDRFSQRFSKFGFEFNTFYPCYGLAEATLLVTGGTKHKPPILANISKSVLESEGRAEPANIESDTLKMVGCGQPHPSLDVRIVNPGDHIECEYGTVGEIWFAGETTSSGYWNDPEASALTFEGKLAGETKNFVRSGDFGFLRDDGELFITGRIKDMFIVRGRNYYFHDLDQSAHQILPDNFGRTVTVLADENEEEIVVLQELPRRFDLTKLENLAESVRNQIATDYGLSVTSVEFVLSSSLPRTSSGKTARSRCQTHYLEGKLRSTHSYNLKNQAHSDKNVFDPSLTGTSNTRRETLIKWVKEWVVRETSISPSQISPEKTLDSIGLNSLQISELSVELESKLNRPISPSILFANPTLERIAEFLSNDFEQSEDGSIEDTGDQNEPIALVGLACRFAGAPNASALWDLLINNVDAISEVPRSRWDFEQTYDPNLRPGKTNSKWGGFLKDIDRFDAEFFNISDAEAASMDPQHRLLLEVAWEALEDAGYTLSDTRGSRTGVFVGISTSDYLLLRNAASLRKDLFWSTGSALSIAANRISYFLGSHGPSIALDTACSSSLVALHLACQSIRSGESSAALVGGVNIMLSPEILINMSQAGATSSDGRCKAFDASADGMVRGEGVGVVVLKRLKHAVRDGDRIYAVVRGTASNHCGHSAGITAPNPQAQSAVIRDAYRNSGVAPESIQYVEAHGPGTILGDPIELEALAKVVSPAERKNHCRIGSLKTNIGHTEAAAGVGGLIKVALSLHHGMIPASLHFYTPNPKIAFDKLKLAVVSRTEKWQSVGGVRRGAVSAFGFGGTNAHAVLESSPTQTMSPPRERVSSLDYKTLVFSGPDRTALKAVAKSYRNYLTTSKNTQADFNLDDFVYSAGKRRSRHLFRATMIGRSTDEIVDKLDLFIAGEADRMVYWGENSTSIGQPVFVFSGYSDNALTQCRQLMRFTEFAGVVEACEELNQVHLGQSLVALFDTDSKNQVDFVQSQIALFTLQVALSALWQSWGCRPAAVLGHSVGEVAAAHVVGALSLEDAFRLLVHRSKLMKEQALRYQKKGVMVAILLDAEKTKTLIEASKFEVEIAAHNAPTQTVCAGEQGAMDLLLEHLTAANIPFRLLDVPGPGHTSFVSPVQETLANSLSFLKPDSVPVAFYSSMSGASCSGDSLGAEYWAEQIRKPVLFVGAVESAIADGHRLFLELGGQASVSVSIAASLRNADKMGWSIPSLRSGQVPTNGLACALGQLYIAGASIDWDAVYPQSKFVSQPSYPWKRSRHWFEEEQVVEKVPTTANPNVPIHGHRLAVASDECAFWQRWIATDSVDFIAQHKVAGVPLMPAVSYIAMVVSACVEATGWSDLTLLSVKFEEGLFLHFGESRLLQTSLFVESAGKRRFEIHVDRSVSKTQPKKWRRLATGWICESPKNQSVSDLSQLARQNLKQEFPVVNHLDLYRDFDKHGISYGPKFQCIQRLVLPDDHSALANIIASDPPESELFQPEALDACLQPAAATVISGEVNSDQQLRALPVSIDRLRIRGALTGNIQSYVKRNLTPVRDQDSFSVDTVVFDDNGELVVEIENFLVEALDNKSHARNHFLNVVFEPLEVQQIDNETPRHIGVWLIVGARGKLAKLLGEKLVEQGQSVLFLENMTVKNIEQLGVEAIHGVIDTRCLDRAQSNEVTDPAEAIWLTCRPIIQTLQALNRPNMATWGARLWLITQGAIAARPDDTVDPIQSAIWGLARTISAEQSRSWGGIIDLELNASEDVNTIALANAILQLQGEEIAIRDERVYFSRLSPMANQSMLQQSPRFHPDATYLISGGLGELGRELARWMVENDARRIVLLSRTGLPPRSQWGALNPASDDYTKVKVVLELESRGASIEIAAVDVSSREALNTFLNNRRQQCWPEVRGVFHLAGIVRPTPLDTLQHSSLIEHCAAKASGSWNLHCALSDQELDFFVLFSSGAALLGSPGLSAYAMANSFLDSLALLRQREGKPGLSINWGLWKEAGMAARLLDAENREMPRGMKGIGNHEAMQMLAQAMQLSSPNVAILPFDWDQWFQHHPYMAKSPFFTRLKRVNRKAEEAGTLSRSELLAIEPKERLPVLEKYLSEQLANVIQVEPTDIDIDRSLSNLGVDSLMAVEMRNRLESELEILIPLVELIQGPSIKQLATIVLNQLTEVTAPKPVKSGHQVADTIDSEQALDLLSQLDSLSDADLNQLIKQFVDSDHEKGKFTVKSVNDKWMLSNTEKRDAIHRILLNHSGNLHSLYPASLGQQTRWDLVQSAESFPVDNMSFGWRIRAAIDADILKQAFQILLSRNEALRTYFKVKEGRLVRLVANEIEVPFTEKDVSKMTEAEIQKLSMKQRNDLFDLTAAPALRITLFRRAAEDYSLLVTAHHIVVDFWSLGILFLQLGKDYFNLSRGIESAIEPSAVCYDDFVIAQTKLTLGEKGRNALQYWGKQLGAEVELTELPWDHPWPEKRGFLDAAFPYEIDAALSAQLKKMAKEHQCTLFTLLLAIFKLLLYSYSRQKNILIVAPTAGRGWPEFHAYVGEFANHLFFYSNIQEDASWREFTNSVRHTVLDAMAHEDFPFTLVAKRVHVKKVPEGAVPFPVKFNMPKAYTLTPESGSTTGGVIIPTNAFPAELELIDRKISGTCDLHFGLLETSSGLAGSWQFNVEVFDAETIEEMAIRYTRLIELVISNDRLTLAELVAKLPDSESS